MKAGSCAEHPRYVAGCEGCKRRAREYARNRLWSVYGNTWDGTVQGDELELVREHVRGLLVLPGVTVPTVATVAGLPSANLYRLMNSEVRFVQGVTAKSVSGVTAERVLAVAASRVDSTGVARRLQALAAEQWDSVDLSPLCGAHRVTLGRWRLHRWPTIRMAQHRAVVDMYDKIQGMANPLGPSPRIAAHAEREGYLPPERWGDDIDDPDAEPLPPPPDTDDHVEIAKMVDDALRHPTPGKAAGYDRSIKREIARQALGTQLGWSLERVAELLGYKSAHSVEYLLNGRKDRPHTRQKGQR